MDMELSPFPLLGGGGGGAKSDDNEKLSWLPVRRSSRLVLSQTVATE